MPPNDLELLRLPDREAWRDWLERHHSTSPGVWLAIRKKNATVPIVSYEEAVEEALTFGWIDSRTRALDDDASQQMFTPRKPGGNWARSNKQRVERLTAEGRMRPAGLAAVAAAKADGSWNALDDIEAMVMPPDLAEALEANPKAKANFEAFPPSAKKMTLYWVGTAKTPETRAKRVARSVRDAEANVRRLSP